MAGGATHVAIQFFIYTLLQQVRDLVNKLKADNGDKGVPASNDSGERTILQMSLEQLHALQALLQESESLCERLVGDPQRAVAARSKLGYIDFVLGHVAEFLAWLNKVEAENADSNRVSLLRRSVEEMQFLAHMGRRWLTDRPIHAAELKDACDSLKLSVEAEPEDLEEDDDESMQLTPEPKPVSEYHDSYMMANFSSDGANSADFC